MTDNHARFLKHLDESEDAVHHMEQWFVRKGHYILRLPGTGRPKRHEDWRDHRDSGDFLVGMRMEVKRLSARFTDRKSWPFQDFIVCAKHTFDESDPKPLGYIYLNPGMTHFALLWSSTSSHWHVEERADKRYESYRQEFYVCSPDLASWRSYD